MNPLDTSSLGGWITSVWTLIRGVIGSDDAIFRAAVVHEDGVWLALTVLMVAGLAMAVGQSVVLVANGVRGRRFLLSLVGGALVTGMAVLFWALATWFTARLVLADNPPLRTFAVIFALGTAPAVFGFLLFFPYLGVIFEWVLRIWIFLTVLVGVGVVLDLDFGQALLICGSGWLFFELLTRLPIFDIVQWRNWFWRLTTGRQVRYDPDDVATWLAGQVNLMIESNRPDSSEAHD